MKPGEKKIIREREKSVIKNSRMKNKFEKVTDYKKIREETEIETGTDRGEGEKRDGRV